MKDKVLIVANLNSVYLNSAYDYTISPMDKAIVKTDIQIAVPHGCYGRVGEFLVCRLSSVTLLFFLNATYAPLLCFISFRENRKRITLFIFPFLAPRSGLAAKHFIDVGGESLFMLTPTFVKLEPLSEDHVLSTVLPVILLICLCVPFSWSCR